MKICKKCLIKRNDEDFYKWYKKSGRSGSRTSCKSCDSLINKNYRQHHKKVLIEKRRKRTGAQPKKICTDPIKMYKNAQVYRSIKKHPEKMAARILLNSHVKCGKVIKPEACEMCHEKKKIEAHHEDYSKPLEVQWVCKGCHTMIHWNTYKGRTYA